MLFNRKPEDYIYERTSENYQMSNFMYTQNFYVYPKVFLKKHSAKELLCKYDFNRKEYYTYTLLNISHQQNPKS